MIKYILCIYEALSLIHCTMCPTGRGKGPVTFPKVKPLSMPRARTKNILKVQLVANLKSQDANNFFPESLEAHFFTLPQAFLALLVSHLISSGI